MRSGRLARWLPPLAFALLVLVLWQVLVEALDVRESTLPPPTEVLAQVWEQRSLLLSSLWVTAQEILIGLALALVLGVGLGALVATSRTLYRAVYPWIVVSQTIPLVAIAPLLVIWFGFTILPKVIVIALVCFFPVVVNTVDGLRAADPQMIDLMRTFRAGRWRIFRSVQLPCALPFVFSGMKVAAVLSVVGAVFGEWSGASEGLGYLILVLNNQVATAEMFAVVLVLSMLGLVLFLAVSLAERLALPWYFQERAEREPGGSEAG